MTESNKVCQESSYHDIEHRDLLCRALNLTFLKHSGKYLSQVKIVLWCLAPA